MDTDRPATPSSKCSRGPSPPRVHDLTFLLAPPETGAAADEIREAAEAHGIELEDLWIEMIRDAVRRLLEPDADGRSLLDGIFSDALGEPVTVRRVNGVEHHQCGRRIPGLIVECASILDSAGEPVVRDFTDRELRGHLIQPLLRLTHAEWATCTAAMPAGEAAAARGASEERRA